METPPEAIEQLLSITVPNSRQVRWRFAQVAKIFGILRHGVDPRRINLQALLRKYRGTVVMEEVLSKLFHERMDVRGATDVLRGLQSGVLSLQITAQGPLAIQSYRHAFFRQVGKGTHLHISWMEQIRSLPQSLHL